MKIKVVCIQTNSSKFPEKNIEMLDKIFRKITCEKINLICLPECVAIFSDEKKRINNFLLDWNNRFLDLIKYYSKKKKSYILIGSVPQKSKNNKFFNKKIIFNSEHRSNNGVHFGCRMIDYKGSILISLGDRGDRNNSQNPKNYPGTILKLNYQGIPDVNVENWKSGIFSIGHRNPQGLIYLKEFDEVWSHEHGPKGGDEINIIKKK